MPKFFCRRCGHAQESGHGAWPTICTACYAKGITGQAKWSMLPYREQPDSVQTELSYMDRRMLRAFGIAEE